MINFTLIEQKKQILIVKKYFSFKIVTFITIEIYVFLLTGWLY